MKVPHYLKTLLTALGLCLFFGLILMFGTNNYSYTLLFSAFLTLLSLAGSWTIRHWLLPELTERQSTFKFVIHAILIILVVSILILSFNIVCIGFLPGLNMEGLPLLSRSFYTILFLVVLILSISAFNHLREIQQKSLTENLRLKATALETEIESKAQELNLLKSQIQPHFLFNSLNTIYGQALTKSDKAPDTILKLSALLDYILYCTQKERVALQTEIEHIQEFIELEKIRFEDSLEAQFEYPEVSDLHLDVPPMLFLPLIENAFKHGKPVDGKLKCNFSLSLEENIIHFKAENSSGNTGADNSGIGLKNLRRRLDLLYGEKYSLNLGFNNESFLAELIIPRAKTA